MSEAFLSKLERYDKPAPKSTARLLKPVELTLISNGSDETASRMERSQIEAEPEALNPASEQGVNGYTQASVDPLEAERKALRDETEALNAQKTALEHVTQQLKDCLTQLADDQKRHQRAAQDAAMTHVNALVQQMFPVLGRQFLCEEVAHFLDAQLPPLDHQLTVRVSKDLKPYAQKAIPRKSKQRNAYKLVTDSKRTGLALEVDWVSGGGDVDFDRLLEACLQNSQRGDEMNQERSDDENC